MYAPAIEATGKEAQTLMHAASVAGKVEICRRRQNLSWSHHQEVASLLPAEQDKWLDMAESKRSPLLRIVISGKRHKPT